jgi:hypothetical protein
MRAPEGPRGAVDRAVGARGRDVRNRGAKAGDVLAAVARAVEVDVPGDAVQEAGFRDLHAAVEQVDDLFLARVLQHLEAGHRHRIGVLGDGELRRADRAVGRDVDQLVAGVAVGVVRARVVVHDLFQDHVSTGEGAHVALALQATQKRVVVREVVRQLARTLLDRRGDDVGYCRVGESHDGLLDEVQTRPPKLVE